MNQKVLVGILFVVLSQLAFALMDSSIKWLGSELSTATIVFFRNLVTLLWVAPAFWLTGEVKNSFKRLPLHAIRSLSGQIGMILIFTSLAVLPLSDATVLRSLTPLFVPLLAAIWLKEKLTWVLIPSFILAMIGSWMLASADKPQFSLLSFIPIIAGIFVALAMVAIKRVSKVAGSSEIVFYFSFTGCISAMIFAAFTEFNLPTDLRIWGIIVLMGFFGSLGQVWVTKANQMTDASLLAPFYYLNAVFGAILSHFFWHERLGIWGWMGAVLIISGGLLLVFKRK
ncbi:DMT family transporter [Wohlfahrtiimonas chitiniclastica]|uniref:EamA domain-containing protein n=2 Tax=Wohlfahrtiimonas chitiniclastica TaxID=400946 RepID=L8XUM9_9GAMM|nr:DMT family transporter [Wohlfahrtiimonas chitiniclastica]ELV07753.1 Hypothetical protein F387_01233 [Wohlfahrtiimonas chitiniclastica SH04]MBS7815434.1 DMT family transporter [Wohlfahrtiimonas chitiniclastica]MBS7819508.1 DMT family transporter [Wohlfahrtiimonas chitiniclastica]MBS7825263.1 DMT family transporter [Wohlfahrtiimonas chitiniclastica]MBS7827153.1 DMT family transporter [Wohlfahrtiimonas chitiniclastica]